jgi:uncharacterized C2H2 Zn-finger protein
VEDVEPDETACPFCAETIKAAAIKCKHCGEMLTSNDEPGAGEQATSLKCPSCGEIHTSAKSLYDHRVTMHGYYHYGGAAAAAQVTLACPKCHTLTNVAEASTSDACSWCGLVLEGETRILSANQPRALPPPSGRGNPGYSGTMGERKRLSAVADRSGGVLACPRCGSTQFTAKRSNKGKIGLGVVFLPAALIAPKTQVKCVACGLKFKRG